MTMASLVSVVSTLALFALIMVVFTREKLDYVSISILAAFAAVLIVLWFPGDEPLSIFPDGSGRTSILDFIEFDALVFVGCMQIIVHLVEKNKVFQWIILKALRATKGNHRAFFYLILTISSLSAAVISDITVAIIFVPMVIRACRVLEINAAPYIYGVSFTINIGSIYTPFSSAENIIISSSFDLTTPWFLETFTPLLVYLLLATLFLLDYFMLRKINPPGEQRKKLILKIMVPSLVIVDKKKFWKNFIMFFTIVACFVVFPEAYLVAMIGAVLMALVNREHFSNLVKEIDWKVVLFLVASMVLIGTMQVNGTFSNEVLGGLLRPVISGTLLSALVLLLIISVLSGFLAQVPTAIVIIALLKSIFDVQAGGDVPVILIIAFLLGINIGSNFLPQGAACDLIALNLALKYRVTGFNYRSLLRNGTKITLFHLVNSFVFLVIYSTLNGVPFA